MKDVHTLKKNSKRILLHPLHIAGGSINNPFQQVHNCDLFSYVYIHEDKGVRLQGESRKVMASLSEQLWQVFEVVGAIIERDVDAVAVISSCDLILTCVL